MPKTLESYVHCYGHLLLIATTVKDLKQILPINRQPNFKIVTTLVTKQMKEI